MARGTTLTEILAMVRGEASQSSSVAAGADYEASLIQKIQRTQQLLYDDFDWSFMRVDWNIPLSQNVRYYDYPQEVGFPGLVVLDLESIEYSTINYSGKPTPIDRGITWVEYAQYNSDNGDTASPARKWDIRRTTDAKEQIEMWPVPADNTQIFTLRGKKKLRPLVAPGDVADLDDILIALTVASEMLEKAGAKNANSVKAAASRRKTQMQGRAKGSNTAMPNMAGPRHPYISNRGKTIIRIGSQTND